MWDKLVLFVLLTCYVYLIARKIPAEHQQTNTKTGQNEGQTDRSKTTDTFPPILFPLGKYGNLYFHMTVTTLWRMYKQQGLNSCQFHLILEMHNYSF